MRLQGTIRKMCLLRAPCCERETAKRGTHRPKRLRVSLGDADHACGFALRVSWGTFTLLAIRASLYLYLTPASNPGLSTMTPQLRLLWATSVFAGLFFGQASAAEKPAPEAGIDVLTRGPIHEAFAQLSAVNPDPTPEVPRKPPDPIPELPPEQKPPGSNVQWVPGY